MTTVAVIPARFASSRFPGKLLARQTGKFLIQHVYEQVCAASSIDRVIVAADDERIVSAVRSFDGEACLTAAEHTCGTSRVAEVVVGLDLADDDLVLNVQGDEPDLHPVSLDTLVARLQAAADDWQIGTLATPFADRGPRTGPGSPLDPNCVKVVTDRRGRALYFSRSLIPYSRAHSGLVTQPSAWLLHLGVYAFPMAVLRSLGMAYQREAPALLEQAESLEQLRWLEAGLSIGVVVVEHGTRGVNSPEDYAEFVERVSAEQPVAAPVEPVPD